MKRTTAALLVLIFAGAAWATGQYVVAPATVVVPHYAAAHVPAEQHADGDRLAAIESRLRRIEDKLDEILKLAKEGTEPAEPTAADPSAREVLKTAAAKCAACHHADVFEAKGAGFQLFTADGKFAKLTNRS